MAHGQNIQACVQKSNQMCQQSYINITKLFKYHFAENVLLKALRPQSNFPFNWTSRRRFNPLNWTSRRRSDLQCRRRRRGWNLNPSNLFWAFHSPSQRRRPWCGWTRRRSQQSASHSPSCTTLPFHSGLSTSAWPPRLPEGSRSNGPFNWTSRCRSDFQCRKGGGSTGGNPPDRSSQPPTRRRVRPWTFLTHSGFAEPGVSGKSHFGASCRRQAPHRRTAFCPTRGGPVRFVC
jgi:hypothetical protein